MNVIGLSNLFNLIAQQLGFKGYHYGYFSDINRSIDNNFNSTNSIGRQYPAMLVEPPTTASVFLSAVTSQYGYIFHFLAPYAYNNDSTTNTAQFIEQEQALKDLANRFFYSLMQVGSSPNLAGGNQYVSIASNTINFDAVENNEGVDGLMHIAATCILNVQEACPLNLFSIAAIDPAYAFPPSQDSDYEKIVP